MDLDQTKKPDRFSYTEDRMGNLTLKDTVTGETVFLQGDDARKLEDQVPFGDPEKMSWGAQSILAEYFYKQGLL